MRTIEAVILRLEQQAVGLGGTTIFGGSDAYYPTGPESFLSLLETAGNPSIGVHNANALRRPSLQVTARGDLFNEVGTLIESAFVALGGLEPIVNTTIGDIFFLFLHPSGEPFQLVNDARGRVRLAFNLVAMRR